MSEREAMTDKTTTASDSELRECQHGNPAKLQIKTPSSASGKPIYFVTCGDDCPPAFHSTAEGAITAHNTRKPSKAIDEIVERWFADSFGDKAALKSALAFVVTRPAQPVDRGWLPIETAPLDGTVFRAYSVDLVHPDFNPWGTVEAVFDGEKIIGAVWDGQFDCWNTVPISPTHWQSMPDSPSYQKEVAHERIATH